MINDCSLFLEVIKKAKYASSDYTCGKVAKLKQLLEEVKDVLEQKDMHKKGLRSLKINDVFVDIKKEWEQLRQQLGPFESDIVANVIEMEDGIMFWKYYVGTNGSEKPSLQTITDSISKASHAPLRYTLDTFFPAVSSSNTEIELNKFSKFVKLVSTDTFGSGRLIECGEKLSDGEWKQVVMYYTPAHFCKK